MAPARARAVVAIVVLLAAFLLAGACTDQPAPPRRRAEVFYDAIADGRLDAARACLVDGAGLRALERRFGSFAAWATRATKNETVMRAEVLAENVTANRARVEMVLLFNDGTRRHDFVELVRGNDAWKLDPRSLPGAERPRANPQRRRHAILRRAVSATGAAS